MCAAGLSVNAYAYLMQYLPYRLQPNGRDCLVVGLGAGFVPAGYSARGIRTDVVDIDPLIPQLARDYFGFATSGDVVVADARHFLLTTPRQYDYIILDAYNGDLMPHHLISREMFTLIAQHLRPGGVLGINFIGSVGEQRRMTASVVRTLRSVFEMVDVYPVFDVTDANGVGNLEIVAYQGARSLLPLGEVPGLAIHPRVQCQGAWLYAHELSVSKRRRCAGADRRLQPDGFFRCGTARDGAWLDPAIHRARFVNAMSDTHALLRLLADGRFHSGVALGDALGVTRATVWNDLQTLKHMGIDVYAVAGKGYRLPAPLELLAAEEILDTISPPARAALKRLDVHLELPSTNAYLVEHAQRGAPAGWACLAERQSAGRGRRGRTWVSPFGGNIYLSVLWRFNSGAAVVGGLSLALGVAVAEALHAAAVPGIGLKCPTMLSGRAGNWPGCWWKWPASPPGRVMSSPASVSTSRWRRTPRCAIDQPWVDMVSITGVAPARNHLAGMLLQHVLLTLQSFERDGFAKFLPRWRARDAYAGKPAVLQLPQQTCAAVSTASTRKVRYYSRTMGRPALMRREN